mmetsp:Transcript_1521/g.4864  ORF Transcript_1521/g.4864 Transcript_1521/m.4864 type:complete len:217 (-) Transcript_1521:135-785(-)
MCSTSRTRRAPPSTEEDGASSATGRPAALPRRGGALEGVPWAGGSSGTARHRIRGQAQSDGSGTHRVEIACSRSTAWGSSQDSLPAHNPLSTAAADANPCPKTSPEPFSHRSTGGTLLAFLRQPHLASAGRGRLGWSWRPSSVSAFALPLRMDRLSTVVPRRRSWSDSGPRRAALCPPASEHHCSRSAPLICRASPDASEMAGGGASPRWKRTAAD